MSEEVNKEETFEEVFNQAASEADGDVVTKTVKEEKVAEIHINQDEADKKDKEPETKDDNDKKLEEVDDFKHKYNTLKGMFDKMSKDFEGYKKEKQEVAKKTEEPLEIAPKPDEVDEELEGYLKEYDYIAKNQQKLTEKSLRKVLKEFETNFKKDLAEKLDVPTKKVDILLESKLQEEYQEHISSIMEAHEDYGKAYNREDIEGWINSLGGTRKKICQAILEDGETNEVIDLIGEFKEFKGIAAADKAVDEKTKQREEKLKSMETVEGKKSVIGGNIRKAEDYDSAFAEAASKDDKKK